MNKVLSVLLGLVVVVILLAILSSRLRKNSSGTFLFGQARKVTPTVQTPKSPTSSPRRGVFSFLDRNTRPSQAPTSRPARVSITSSPQTKGVQSIPKTGPGLLLPIVVSSLAAGVFIKKRS